MIDFRNQVVVAATEVDVVFDMSYDNQVVAVTAEVVPADTAEQMESFDTYLENH